MNENNFDPQHYSEEHALCIKNISQNTFIIVGFYNSIKSTFVIVENSVIMILYVHWVCLIIFGFAEF